MKLWILAAMLLLPASLSAWPAKPVYVTLTNTADLIVTGRVEEVNLAAEPGGLTEVIIAVNKIHKGMLSDSAKVSIFHEPSEYKPKRFDGGGSGTFAFRCPPLPRLIAGESYKFE